MKFLNGFTIDVKKVPAYKQLSERFKVPVDKKLCKLMIDYNAKRPDGQPVISSSSKEMLIKVTKCIAQDWLDVKMNPRLGKLGRRYPDIPDEYREFRGIKKKNEDYGKIFSGLISLPRVVKNTIFKFGNWADFDQVKGHATILAELGTKNDMNLPSYNRYITEFDDIVDEMIKYYSPAEGNKLTRSHVKTLFNLTIYGGGHKKWLESVIAGTETKMNGIIISEAENGVAVDPKIKPNPFYQEFKRETDILMTKIYEANEELQDIVCVGEGYEDKERDIYKRKNRVMSYYCQVIENELTYVAYKWMTTKDRMAKKNQVDWGYDGLTIPNCNMNDLDVKLNDMNEYIVKHTGFTRVKFIHKVFGEDEILNDVLQVRMEMNDDVEDETSSEEEEEELDDVSVITSSNDEKATIGLSDEDKLNCVYNDLQASERILQLLEGQILKNQRRIYIKDKHVWSCDTSKVRELLTNFILKSPLFSISKKGEVIDKVYANIKRAENVFKTIVITLPENASFDYDLFHSTTKYRLCFQNGVLDFWRKKFYNWDEVDFPYYTTIMIPTDYYPIPLKECMELEQIVLEPLFNNSLGTAVYYLSRSIAGCIQDKNFGTYIGNRDCGKGVLAELLKGFGQYSGSFKLDTILEFNGKSFPATSKDNQWMLNYEFTRIMTSQEIPDAKEVVIASDRIKQMCSGGDDIQARRNYDREDTIINPDFSIFVIGNCDITTRGDTNNHRVSLSGFTSFISQKQYDDKIEAGASEASMQKYRIADDSVKEKAKTPEWRMKMINLLYHRFNKAPLKVDLTEIDEDDDDDDMKKFMECFEITGNKDDKVLQASIKSTAGCTKKIYPELQNVRIPKVDVDGNPVLDKNGNQIIMRATLVTKCKLHAKDSCGNNMRDKNVFFGIRPKN